MILRTHFPTEMTANGQDRATDGRASLLAGGAVFAASRRLSPCGAPERPRGHPGRRSAPWLALACGLVLGLLPAPAQARLNVVTLPGRDTVQLTIYNSVDLTLVKESRTLVFRQGLNKLEFSWANTLIDPTSVEFQARTHADAVEVLDVSFPPRVANTLEWRVRSDWAGEVQVEIRYFTSGIRWAADYTTEAARDDKTMTLAAHVRVSNQSGEDYEDAQVRLVVGTVRLVEQIAQLARQREVRGDAVDKDAIMTDTLRTEPELRQNLYARFSTLDRKAGVGGRGGSVEIVKEEMSEYFLYTVDSRDTIPTGWAKRLPSFKTAGVPITSYYKFEREQWGDRVLRYYRFTNSAPSKLGKEPLPDGTVKAFRLANPEGLYAFVGATQVKYIPINEFVELELGADQEVLVKPALLNWEKTDLRFDANGDVKGWTVKETWEFALQNSKDLEVVLDIRRSFPGDWDLQTATPYEKLDAAKVKFLRPLKAREKQQFTYQLTTRYGLNVTR